MNKLRALPHAHTDRAYDTKFVVVVILKTYSKVKYDYTKLEI